MDYPFPPPEELGVPSEWAYRLFGRANLLGSAVLSAYEAGALTEEEARLRLEFFQAEIDAQWRRFSN